tara:strand:+ start:209 stop:529 length:321 start_codon:yes stop_codon:yes gene_type:complete
MGESPYYATIFTTKLTDDLDGYDETADRMAELVANYDGYLGMCSARESDGFGITICYWRSLEDIDAWRVDIEHQLAQSEGRQRWYAEYTVEIARVERNLEFDRFNP